MTRRYIIFGLVALALLMGSIDNTIVAVGLPAMRAGLRTNLLLIGWTVTIYQFGQLLVLPLAGKLSDELGRKRVFLAAVLVFTGASFMCGFAPNVYVLILFRLLQALGGGAFLPSCTGIVADLFPEKRGQAIGMFSSIFPIGGVIGPNIGGVIIDHLSWRSLFYINVPLGIAVLALTWWLYQAPPEVPAHHRIDFAGVALYGGAVGIILGVLTWLGKAPRVAPHSPLLWLLVAAAIGLFVQFARHESRTAEPMLNIVLLKRRPFLAANAYGFLWGAGVFGFVSFLPTYAELHYHMTATQAGALLTPRGIVMIVVSMLASFLLIRSGYRVPMIAGVLIVSVSLVLTSLGPDHPSILGLHVSTFVYLATVIALLGVGFGLSGPASNNAALDLMPEKIAALTGIRAMFRQTGGTLGTGTMIFVVSLFDDPARGFQIVFVVLAFVLLLIVPLVFLIPDRARESRQRMREVVAPAEPAVAIAHDS